MSSAHPSASAIAFRFDGTFDLAAARQFHDAMVNAPSDVEVYVDFSRVRDFSDNAAAVLSEALRLVGSRASVRGLRQHQHRLLRYLGAPPSALAQVP